MSSNEFSYVYIPVTHTKYKSDISVVYDGFQVCDSGMTYDISHPCLVTICDWSSNSFLQSTANILSPIASVHGYNWYQFQGN